MKIISRKTFRKVVDISDRLNIWFKKTFGLDAKRKVLEAKQDLTTMDEAFIEEWLESPQTSLYYSLQVMGDVQDKSDAYAALADVDIDDYLATILEDSSNEPTCDCQE